jgi:putative toxin-antitoxin system antitoxin component (TIGR02293 family)
VEGHLAQGDNSMESVFVLAEKPLLEILTQVRNGLPAPMFEQVASALGLSTSTLAAKVGIARRTVTRKRGNGAPLSSETSEKLLRVARVRNLGRALFATDAAVSEWLSKPEQALVRRAFGDAWLKTNNLAALRVPTVITPGEWNVLLHPLHPQFSQKWVVTGPDAYTFDARLLPVKKGTRSRRSPRDQSA